MPSSEGLLTMKLKIEMIGLTYEGRLIRTDRLIRHAIKILVLFMALLFLDYTLPSRDIVTVVGTEVVRTDIDRYPMFWSSSDDDSSVTSDVNSYRDIRFISSIRSNEKPRVYRNEDTGWGWPPYLKFSSGNLQAEAQKLIGSGQWVAVTHYGWRSTLLSIYPNVTKMTPIDGPDVTLIPWFRIIFGILLVISSIILWRSWMWCRDWMTDRIDRWRARF